VALVLLRVQGGTSLAALTLLRGDEALPEQHWLY
jgi:hypothetical protein